MAAKPDLIKGAFVHETSIAFMRGRGVGGIIRILQILMGGSSGKSYRDTMKILRVPPSPLPHDK